MSPNFTGNQRKEDNKASESQIETEVCLTDVSCFNKDQEQNLEKSDLRFNPTQKIDNDNLPRLMEVKTEPGIGEEDVVTCSLHAVQNLCGSNCIKEGDGSNALQKVKKEVLDSSSEDAVLNSVSDHSTECVNHILDEKPALTFTQCENSVLNDNSVLAASIVNTNVGVGKTSPILGCINNGHKNSSSLKISTSDPVPTRLIENSNTLQDFGNLRSILEPKRSNTQTKSSVDMEMAGIKNYRKDCQDSDVLDDNVYVTQSGESVASQYVPTTRTEEAGKEVDGACPLFLTCSSEMEKDQFEQTGNNTSYYIEKNDYGDDGFENSTEIFESVEHAENENAVLGMNKRKHTSSSQEFTDVSDISNAKVRREATTQTRKVKICDETEILPETVTTWTDTIALDSDLKNTAIPGTAERNVVVDPQIESFRKEQENKSTVRKTKAHVRLFQEFMRTNSNDFREIHQMQPAELDRYLQNFFLKVRKPNNEEYEPCYLKNIHCSLERHLRNVGYKYSLTECGAFQKSRETLKAKQIQLKIAGKGNKPRKAEAISDNEVQELFLNGQLGDQTAESVLNTLWWNNTTFFGLRGIKEHRDLCWGDVVLKESENGSEYLELVQERQTKTRAGEHPKNVRPINPKMFATSDEHCPVALYKLYESKRPIDLCKEDDPFYLQDMPIPKSGDHGKWFKKQPVGKNKLSHIMKRMVSKSGLKSDKRLTNTSACKHLIQKLVDNNVDAAQIVQITGHKTVQSINSYSAIMSEGQQEKLSNLLSNATCQSNTKCHVKGQIC